MNKLFAAILIVTLAACHNNSDLKKEDVKLAALNDIQEKNKAEEVMADTTVVQFTPPKIVPDKAPTDLDRKIIKTADIKLELQKFDDFNSSIHKAVKQYGGYIAAEEQRNTDFQLENTVTIKVPVDRFEELINSFAGNGIKVLERTISSEDVSSEYVDSKSRMEARKQVRARYIELLKDAKKMSDVLAIQSQINSTQEEVEAAAGKMQLLKQQSAYSTVNLTYLQYINGKLPAEPTYITKITDAFQSGFYVVGRVILVFISLWPLLIVGVIIYLMAKRYKPLKIKA